MELFVKDGNPSGGAVVQTYVWMQAFRELGFEILQARMANDDRPLLPEFKWIRTVPIYHPDRNRKRLAWFTHRFPSIFKALRNNGCTHLYISIPVWTTFYIGLMCRFLGIRSIIRIANDNILDERIYVDHTKLQAFLMSLAFRTSDMIIAQNEFQYQSIKRKYRNSKAFKIFNPIVIDSKYLVAKELSDEGYIAWVANFRYQKNLSLLHDIAKKIPNAKFKVAGEPKYPLDHETEVSLRELEKMKNVEFVGTVGREAILQFFSKANFLLNTSRYEGFSNTFLEAMITGTPILTTMNVNPDGIIEKFGLGYIYSDENSLAEILGSVTTKDYMDRSNNCIEYVVENHDHLKLGQRLLGFMTL